MAERQFRHCPGVTAAPFRSASACYSACGAFGYAGGAGVLHGRCLSRAPDHCPGGAAGYSWSAAEGRCAERLACAGAAEGGDDGANFFPSLSECMVACADFDEGKNDAG